MRITQKLPLTAAASAQIAADSAQRKGDDEARAADEREAAREAQALMKRAKVDPATEGDGEDSDDQSSPDSRRLVSEVGMRLAPLPMPLHGISASSPLYAAALELARIQHGGGAIRSGPRKFIADATLPAQLRGPNGVQLQRQERSLFVVIFQVRAVLGGGRARGAALRYAVHLLPLCAMTAAGARPACPASRAAVPRARAPGQAACSERRARAPFISCR